MKNDSIHARRSLTTTVNESHAVLIIATIQKYGFVDISSTNCVVTVVLINSGIVWNNLKIHEESSENRVYAR